MAFLAWLFAVALVFYSLVGGAWGVAAVVGVLAWWTRPRRDV
jgi:hypothetical protein